MKLNRTENAIKGILFGSINKIASLLLPFIVRSLLIAKLGIEYVGLNTIFTSILSILSFAELGFGQVMIYSLYEPIAENNTEKICALYNYYRKVYRVIGLVMLIIGLTVMPFISFFVTGECPADVNLYVLYGIYLFNTVASYWLFAYKDCLLSAHQQYYLTSIALFIITVLKSGIEIAVLLLFKSYYAYAIVLPATTVIYNFIICYFANKYYPQYQCKGTISKEEQKEIGRTVAAGIGHKLGPTATTSIDNLVISSALGVVALGIYSNYYYILNAVTAFFSIAFTSLAAGIGNSLVTESEDKNYTDFKNLSFINNWLVGVCSTCLLCLYKPFMKLWVGESMSYTGMSTIVLLSTMFYTQQLRSVVTTYKSAAGMWRIDRYKPYVTAGMNCILDIVLVRVMGINGIVLSTILARSLIGLPWETQALFKQLFKKKTIGYYMILIRNALIWVVLASITWYLCSLILIEGILGFIIKAVISLALPSSIYLLIFSRSDEFCYMFLKFKSLLHLG